LYAYPGRERAPFLLRCEGFQAEAGSITCVIGGNGAGKTTLLSILRRKASPQQGQILLENRPLENYAGRDLRRMIGWVDATAASSLVDQLLVVDHLALALLDAGQRVPIFHRRLTRERLRAIDGFDAGLFDDLVDLLPRRVAELSSGQRQKLTIALALAGVRKVILADETTAHLDYRNARAFFEVLTGVTSGGVAAVVATHDLLLAAEFGKRVFFIREGVVSELRLTAPFSIEGRLKQLRERLSIHSDLSSTSTNPEPDRSTASGGNHA
jgi:ABC-type cobalamin/Fe3+-siderophores transport system ATPase subunit